jgi:hypothetical protein
MTAIQTEQFVTLAVLQKVATLCEKFQLAPTFMLPICNTCSSGRASITEQMSTNEVITNIVTALTEYERNSIVMRFINKHGHKCTVGFKLDLGNLWWTNHTTDDSGDTAHAGDLWLQCYLFGGPVHPSDTFKTLTYVRSLLDDTELLKQHNKY